MPSPRNKLAYIPALDGVRALAIVAVLAFHFGFSWAPGGFAGVEVFFVLSGWLICAKLVAEHRAEGVVDLVAFWRRRARRLVPAAGLVVLTTLVVAALANYDRLAELRMDAAAAMTFVLNWRLASGTPFFATDPSPLQHLWSLTIQEQFYLLFPLLLATALAAKRKPDRIVPLVVGLAGGLTLWRLVLLSPSDPARAYFGTDTRAPALLAGVALGLAWTPRRLRPVPVAWAAPAFAAVGLGMMATIGWYVHNVGDDATGAFGLKLTLVQVAAVVLVAILVHPSGMFLALPLAAPPLRWIGQRAYGLYLWHWPIAVAFTNRPGERTDSPVATLAMVWLTLACAALSYRFVEEPIRRRGIRGTLRRVRAHFVVNLTGRPLAAGAVTTLLVVALVGTLLLTFRAALAPTTDHSGDGELRPESLALSDAELLASTTTLPRTTTTTARPGVGASSVPLPSTSALPPPDQMASKSRTTTAIGDSIMLAAVPNLSARLPGIVVDAEVSRQGADLGAHVDRLLQARQLGDVVVVHLGANGPFPATVIDQLVEVAGKRRVVLVNSKVPRRWEPTVNSTLADAAALHRSVRLVDWYSVASNEAGLIASDGYHLTPAGAERYASLIAAAVNEP